MKELLLLMFGRSLTLSRFAGPAFVLCVAATICFPQEKKETDPAFNTVQYSDKSWIEYKPTGGRFSVLFPGTPAESSQTLDPAFGKRMMQMSALLVQIEETFAVCFTAYSDFPVSITGEDTIRKVLDGGRKELLSAKPTRKLIAEKDIPLDSYRGRELTVEDGDLILVQRLFLVEKRLYQVSVGFPKGSTHKIVNEVRQKVFSSFKILPAT